MTDSYDLVAFIKLAEKNKMLSLSDEVHFLIKRGLIAFLMIVMMLKTFIYQTKTEIMILSDFFLKLPFIN